MPDTSFAFSNRTLARIRWDNVLAQIRRDHTSIGSKESTTAVSVSVAAQFLQANGQSHDMDVTEEFIAKLSSCLESEEPQLQSSAFKFSSTDSGYLARIKALINAYHAITGKLFKDVFLEAVTNSQLTHKQIAQQTGISSHKLHLIKRGGAFVQIGEIELLTLDTVL